MLGEQVDARSDLYSLGVVLYRMLSGVRPNAETKGEERLRDARRRDAPVPLRERVSEIPRSLENVVTRLLERRPDDRYSSAAMVRELLEPFARGASRETHARLVRRLLTEAGLLKDDLRRTDDRTGSLKRARPALGLFGFVSIGLLFVGAGTLVQATSQKEQRVLATGAHDLPFAPDEAGGLRVTATPWAEVWVDGQRAEVTPFARPIPLSAGTHFVTLKHPSAEDEKRTIEVVRAEVVQLDVTMRLAEDPKK